MRLKIVKLAGFFVFIFLSSVLFSFQFVRAKKYREQSDKNCLRLVPQEGCRGRILDSEGSVIADSKLSYDVMFFPQGESNFNKVLANVSGILELKLKASKSADKFVRVASSMPVTIAKNIGIKKAIALEEMKLENPGLIVLPVPVRRYPNERLACHIIGYLGEIDHWRLTKLEDYGYKTKDIVGFGGIEEKYDYYLRQEEGGLLSEVDHRGRFTRVLGFRQPVNGKDIQLTINLKLQKIAEDALSCKKGSVVVMEPYTGEILAMASYPNFSPGAFADKNASSIPVFLNDLDSPLLNRVISGAYPAGSLFKLIVATAGLETRKINPSTISICQGSMLIGKKEFNCWGTHNQQNLHLAIAHSCNVFFYRAGLILGPQIIYDYAVKFGLSKSVSFDLCYETSGFVPSPLRRKINQFSRFRRENWYDGDTANLSIGQGDVLVTPLQMACMMAVFANKGYLVRPYITKAIDGSETGVFQKKAVCLSLRESTIDEIRRGLREVVSDPDGTANVLSTLAVSVGGKTGTAQAPPGTSHAWFAGFFPFENPKYVICVFLERGGHGYYSALVAKQIIEKMLEEGLV